MDSAKVTKSSADAYPTAELNPYTSYLYQMRTVAGFT